MLVKEKIFHFLIKVKELFFQKEPEVRLGSLVNGVTDCRFESFYSDEMDIVDELDIKYIYHMSHIDNLNSILQNGLISYNQALDLKHIDISNRDVNIRRTVIEPIFNKQIHSYVPFYFNPRNAMLYARREIQNNLVVLAIDRILIYHETSLFTDGNAAAKNTKFFNDLHELKTLNWKCINAKYWTDCLDGKRIKMAEVLIVDIVEPKYIKKIYCNNYVLKQYVESLLQDNSIQDIQVEINMEMFF